MDKNRSMSGKVRPVTMKGFSLLAGGSGYRVHVIFQGLAVGLTAGFASILYRILLGQAERFSFFALSGEEPIPIPLLVPLWCLAAWVIGRIMEWEPLARGSGIPQVEGELLGQISMNWWRVLTAKFLGGALSIALGLSLGREGPSIQIGSASGKGIARLGKKDTLEERLMISSGASAGLSAAFNAPLAGVVFALEEVHKSFSPLILLSAMTASLAADAVSKYVFGLGPIFSFGAPEPLPLGLYGYLLLLGVLCGVGGALFCRVILSVQDLYGKIAVAPRYRIVLPALAAVIVGPALPLVLGGGHPMVEHLAHHGGSLGFILSLFLVNLLFTAFSFGSGAPGGIFLPMLAQGAALGALYGTAVAQLCGVDPSTVTNFLVVGMAGFFTAVVRAPITGILLITEMTGSFSHLLAVSLVALTAHMTADLLKARPIYDALLVRLLRRSADSRGQRDLLLEASICPGSPLDGRAIREAALPKGCLLVHVLRGDEKILPRGDTVLAVGDRLIALADGSRARRVREVLLELAGVPCQRGRGYVPPGEGEDDLRDAGGDRRGE